LTSRYNLDQLFTAYAAKDRLALSRLITMIENYSAEYELLIERLHGFLHNTPRIGITGPPGVGKSTLVNEIAQELRKEEKTVGVIAIDPSSPFTGGALLGDRIRMNRISLDPGVYIRSLATRGSLGGLALATDDVADLMDGFGCDLILIETVGVGQVELDIVKTADTTMVVFSPESGDSIQAMKAGLMEIGDIFILNKSDREGADRAYIEIETTLMHKPGGNWKPPVIKTSVLTREGLTELNQAISKHQEFLFTEDRIKVKQQARRQCKIKQMIETSILNEYWNEERQSQLAELSLQDISVVQAAKILMSLN